MFSYFKNRGYDTFVAGKIFHTLQSDINKQFEYGIGSLTAPRTCLNAGNNGCSSNKFFCTVGTSEDQCAINGAKNFFTSRIGKNISWIAGIGFHRPHLELTITTKGHSKLCNTYIKSSDFQSPVAYQNDGVITDFAYSLSNLQHSDLMYMKVPFNGVFKPMKSKAKYPDEFFVKKNLNTVTKMRQAYCDSSAETVRHFLEIVDSLYKILPQSVNDTDIIFVADHGFQIGQRGIIGKNTLYPEATNVPLFFKIAGESKKRPVKTDYVSSIDIFPSLVELHVAKGSLRGSQNGLPSLDGVSLFGSEASVPISQYPRCQVLGTIQTEDCMTGTNSCLIDGGGRPPIKFMGYLTVKEINGVVYRFSEWFPFNEVRTCGWPFWTGIPQQFVNNLGPWPVWNLQPTSATDFTKESVFKELYTINQR
jgi:hypothetical protein